MRFDEVIRRWRKINHCDYRSCNVSNVPITQPNVHKLKVEINVQFSGDLQTTSAFSEQDGSCFICMHTGVFREPCQTSGPHFVISW